jgi:aromatic ring-opening dioxygenase LigB subunit
MLMAFFERLGRETEQEKINFRFVLALVLMRKRRLKYDSSIMEADKEIWRLRFAGDKQTVDVTNPHLDDEQIEQLSTQIGQILQTDF